MSDPDGAARRLIAETLEAAYAAVLAEADPSEAATKIREVLSGVERDAAPPRADAVELAVLWALITVDDEPSDDLVAWIEWAADAAQRRFGPGHRLTLRAKTARLGVLDWRRGTEAAAQQRAVLGDLAEYAPTPQARVAALELRAVAVHNAGHCQAGIHELVKLCQADINPPVRPRREYLCQLAAMLSACGRFQEARVLLDSVEPGAPSTPGLIPTPIADVAWTHAVRCERQPHNRRGPGPDDPAGTFDWRTLL